MISEISWKSTIYFKGSIDTPMRNRAASPVATCEYCGKKLVVQDKSGAFVDGNIVVLETDRSTKRVCKSCSEKLPQRPPDLTSKGP